MHKIPKIIYVYWNEKELPELIQKTLQTIINSNKDWEVKLFNYDDVLKIDNLPSFIKTKSNLVRVQNDNIRYVSDWLRLHLLYNYGGVYIDISCICFKNFSHIIDVNDDKLYGYNYPSAILKCMENWFLAAPPKHKFVKKWLDETVIARNDNYKYAEENYKFSPELNYALPYLNQHLAWKKIDSKLSETERNKQYKLIDVANSQNGPYFYFKSTAHTNIRYLLSITHPPKNVIFLKLNQPHRNALIKIMEDQKLMKKYKKSYVLKILGINNHKMSRQLNESTNIKQIYFIHIPKTAGTSIEHIFYEKGGCVSSCFFRKLQRNEILENKNYNNVSLWHIPLQYFKQKFFNDVVSKHILFTVVRNPYKRIVSDFKFWIQFYNARHKNIKRKLSYIEKHLLGQIKKIYENNFTLDKQNLNIFINNALSNDKYMISLDGHLIPMHYYLVDKNGDDISNVNILKHENLNNDFNDFIKKHNVDIPTNVTRTYKSNVSDNVLSINDINDENIRLINDIYKKDFDRFSYKMM